VEIKDVTASVKFGPGRDELLPLTKCVCGELFYPWDFVLDTDNDSNACHKCGRRYYFKSVITVYTIKR